MSELVHQRNDTSSSLLSLFLRCGTTPLVGFKVPILDTGSLEKVRSDLRSDRIVLEGIS